MSEVIEKRPSKLWRAVTIATVFLVAGSVGYLHYRNRLGLISERTSGIRIIPRERFGEQPFVDAKLPLLGKVTFPEKGDLPKLYQDAPGVSGLVLIDYASKGVEYDKARSKWDLGDGPCELISDGDELSMYYGRELVVRCPYLFGSTPQRAAMTIGDAECELKLPAMGRPEPEIASVKGESEGWTFEIRPKKWWSPSFKLRFEFTLKGSDPEGLRFVEIWGQPDIHAAFQMHEGDTKTFAIENWSPNQKFMVRISAIEEERFKLKVYRNDFRFDIAYPDGELAFHSSNGLWSNRHLAMRIGTKTISGQQFIGTTDTSPELYGAKNGQILDVTAYKPVKTGGADLAMQLPEATAYPLTTPNRGSARL